MKVRLEAFALENSVLIDQYTKYKGLAGQNSMKPMKKNTLKIRPKITVIFACKFLKL